MLSKIFRNYFFSLMCFLAPHYAAEALEIVGAVEDTDGKRISGAQIFLLNSDRATIASGTTNEKGEFAISGIAPGFYSLLVAASGFPDHQVAAAVQEGSRNRVHIQLGLETVSEEVTVTASHQRVEEAASVPQQINLISSDDLEARAKSALIELANEEAGLSIQRTSPVMGGIFVRGLTGNKVNVFVDGVRYSNSAARGGVNTFLNLMDPANLDAAEVLRGPSSSQYGSDAIGGSMQLLSRTPEFSTSGFKFDGALSSFANSSDGGYGSAIWTSYASRDFSILASTNGRRVNRLRPGGGIDSHNAVTRFFNLPSTLFFEERLPDTEFTQYGGMLKFAWAASSNSRLTASYIRGQQDDGKRYDQLIGGDGNLIADLRNLMLDLFYLKYDLASAGWFDHLTASYSFNSQREERVNQSGNGNPRAAINHEYERTSVHGFQIQTSKLLGMRQTIAIGADFYREGVEAPSFREDAITGATTVRRGRIPDGASFDHGGVFAEYMADVIPEKFRLFTNLRFSAAGYQAEAADAPVVNGKPLWPDDSLAVNSVTYRAGILWTAANGVDLLANFSRGFRSPHITDLGTLGITGSGFEVAFQDVAGLDATIGSTANSNASSTGIEVTQLKPETSQTYEVGARFHADRINSNLTFFLNDVNDNITKQALILPQGAVGIRIGDETIITQTPTGAVFVPSSSSPVLVRTNFDDARFLGIEYTMDYRHDANWSAGATFTYVRAEDRRTGLPPNIEGGTPAPDGYLRIKYAPQRKRFWIEPFVHFALKQDRLSSLDVEDRRTGASRSHSGITNFFYNGATARGFVGPGADAVFGTEDDVLLATGETLSDILLRVLGQEFETNSLFHQIPAYATWNLRFGFSLGERHRFLIAFENLTDENYRGISWGVDGPGRGVYVRYNLAF